MKSIRKYRAAQRLVLKTKGPFRVLEKDKLKTY